MTQTFSTAQTKALSQIVRLASRHKLGINDIEQSLQEFAKPRDDKERSSFAMTLIAYLAGVLILSGLLIYVGMVWETLDSFSRVIFSLGSGLLSYAVGLLLHKDKATQKASLFLWLLSAVLIPTGLFVFLHEFSSGDDVLLAGVFVFGTTLFLYLTSFFQKRLQTFLFLSMLYGFLFTGTLYEYLDINTQLIWLVTGFGFFEIARKMRLSDYHAISPFPFLLAHFSIASGAYYYLGNTDFESLLAALYIGMIATGYILKSRTFTLLSALAFIALYLKQYHYSWTNIDTEFFSLICVTTGASMMLAAEWFKRHSTLSCLWYFFGSSIVFTGLMSLLFQTPFDILFVVTPAFLIFVGSQLKSRALLFSSILALLSFIGYYTATYFADTVGWPIALMICGGALAAISVVGVKMSNKIKNSSV